MDTIVYKEVSHLRSNGYVSFGANPGNTPWFLLGVGRRVALPSEFSNWGILAVM